MANIREFTAPEYPRIRDDQPLVFLAGPIQGAPDWQRSVINSLRYLHRDEIAVANPRRDVLPEDFDYQEQVLWERHHIRRAIKHGSAVFWLARQDPSLPYKEGRPYAQTTRFEAGMAYLAKVEERPLFTLTLGIEPGYEGSEKYYRSMAEELGLPVFSSLNDVEIDLYSALHHLEDKYIEEVRTDGAVQL